MVCGGCFDELQNDRLDATTPDVEHGERSEVRR